MKLSNSSSDDNASFNKWKEVYSKSENLVEIKFSNAANTVKYVWIEPAAYSLELETNTEYKLITHEKSFSIEFTSDQQITLWTDYSFGFKLYKKENKSVGNEWVLDIDMSDIN